MVLQGLHLVVGAFPQRVDVDLTQFGLSLSIIALSLSLSLGPPPLPRSRSRETRLQGFERTVVPATTSSLHPIPEKGVITRGGAVNSELAMRQQQNEQGTVQDDVLALCSFCFCGLGAAAVPLQTAIDCAECLASGEQKELSKGCKRPSGQKRVLTPR